MVGWLGRGGRANTLDVTDRSRLFTCLVVLAEDDNANYHDDITSFFLISYFIDSVCVFLFLFLYIAQASSNSLLGVVIYSKSFNFGELIK